MPSTIKEVVKLEKRAIEQRLNRHKQVLGPGCEFVVHIGVRQVGIVAVIVPPATISRLTQNDWNRIFNRTWVAKYKLALEVIYNNQNQPTSLELIQESSPEFFCQYREQVNRMFKKSGLPYFLRNTVHGFRNARLQVVRR